MADSKQRRIPVVPWMRLPVDIQLFKECPIGLVTFLDPRLEAALQQMRINSLFPVQIAVWQETIGPGSFERDLCINSPTGSGKTLAYALPIVQQLSTRKIRCLRALVVLPTRDLALQRNFLSHCGMVENFWASFSPLINLDVEREELPAHMTRVSATEIRRAQKAEKEATDLKGSMSKRMEFLDID